MTRLTAEGLTKRFGGVVALAGVGLEVADGEVVGLLGPNGAGKTTLFNCLSGVERPDRGTVTLEGQDVTALAMYQRARLGMARTFQRVELFGELSVREHVEVAAESASRQGRVLSWQNGRARAAQAARVEEILDQLGLLGEAGRAAASLSLGKVRLVELARALATEPSVILADEPSSGLDGQERLALASVLRSVTEDGTAVLLVEHDLDLVRQVTTRSYLIDAGTVVASGPTPDLLADPILERTFGRSGVG